MKQGSTLFLRGVVLLLGITVLALCIFALFLAISSEKAGDYRPILIGMCVAAIPFFIALWETLKLLNYIDKNRAFSELSIKALRNIKRCAVVISMLYAVGMPFIVYVADNDDSPGVVAIGLVIIFASAVVAVFAAVLQKLVQNAVEIKSENDLTV